MTTEEPTLDKTQQTALSRAADYLVRHRNMLGEARRIDLSGIPGISDGNEQAQAVVYRTLRRYIEEASKSSPYPLTIRPATDEAFAGVGTEYAHCIRFMVCPYDTPDQILTYGSQDMCMIILRDADYGMLVAVPPTLDEVNDYTDQMRRFAQMGDAREQLERLLAAMVTIGTNVNDDAHDDASLHLRMARSPELTLETRLTHAYAALRILGVDLPKVGW